MQKGERSLNTLELLAMDNEYAGVYMIVLW